MIEAFDAISIGTEIQRRIGVKTSRDEPLARFTTMRVGGPADLFATAHNAFELRALVRFARTRGLPHLVLGRGSDVVIADAGVRGLVIQVRAEGSRIEGTRYTAESGVQMARAATETQHAGLTGLEFGLAIPGTVGGAVWANAGAHDADMAGVLETARLLTADGGEAVVPVAELALGYRDSRLKHGAPDAPRELVIDATFQLVPADPETIKGPASTTSGTGARPTSRSGCRRPAACSGTRPAIRPAGSSRRPGSRACGAGVPSCPRSTRTSSSTTRRGRLPTSASWPSGCSLRSQRATVCSFSSRSNSSAIGAQTHEPTRHDGPAEFVA